MLTTYSLQPSKEALLYSSFAPSYTITNSNYKLFSNINFNALTASVNSPNNIEEDVIKLIDPYSCAQCTLNYQFYNINKDKLTCSKCKRKKCYYYKVSFITSLFFKCVPFVQLVTNLQVLQAPCKTFKSATTICYIYKLQPNSKLYILFLPTLVSIKNKRALQRY